MNSPKFFLVKPKGSQYINNDPSDSLIKNVSIEDAKDVNRVGVVVSVPSTFNSIVEIGDEIVVHHNTFRITFNQQGIPVQSTSYIKKDLFFVYPEMVYMVVKKSTGEKISLNPFVFVTPIIEDGKVLENTGILTYGNQFTESQGIKQGSKVFFKDYSNYEFNIYGEKLYRMKNQQLVAICED